MDIKDARIDMMVRTKLGKTGKIKEITRDRVVIDLLDGSDYGAAFNCIDPVSNPCQSCEMATVITSQCKQIADLQEDRDGWKAFAHTSQRNAAYWREELTKLQKEALAEFKPLKEVAGHFFDEIRPFGPDEFKRLSEVAVCYKQVEPEKLLMSDDARIVCELLEGSGPMTSSEIAVRLIIREMCVLESIIEARDAGRIELVDGKYEIVRD